MWLCSRKSCLKNSPLPRSRAENDFRVRAFVFVVCVRSVFFWCCFAYVFALLCVCVFLFSRKLSENLSSCQALVFDSLFSFFFRSLSLSLTLFPCFGPGRLRVHVCVHACLLGCLCACVPACVCVCACVRVCVCVCGVGCARLCARACEVVMQADLICTRCC